MEIKRDRYLKRIISFMWDGQVKVITGIRRCGKSYLLRNLFKSYLLGEGVAEDHILSFELDLTRDIRYRNPLELASHVREIVEHSADQYYLFVDEIQMSDEVPNPYNPDGKKITFYDALNDLKSLSNLDIYVTGSNSKMLSSDILTVFFLLLVVLLAIFPYGITIYTSHQLEHHHRQMGHQGRLFRRPSSRS